MEFHRWLTRGFCHDMSVGDLHSAARSARHGVAVVDFECGHGRVVVLKVNALQPKVNRIDGQDTLARRAADGAVPASDITGGRFNVVGFEVIQAGLFFGRCGR